MELEKPPDEASKIIETRKPKLLTPENQIVEVEKQK
jgi:hypothetical protein